MGLSFVDILVGCHCCSRLLLLFFVVVFMCVCFLYSSILSVYSDCVPLLLSILLVAMCND